MNALHDRGVISRYREFLPVTGLPVVSLNEGPRRFIRRRRRRARRRGLRQVRPELTRSLRRGMTMAISKACDAGSGGDLRLDRQHRRSGRAARAGLACVSAARGQIRRASCCRRSSRRRGRGLDGTSDARCVWWESADGRFEIVNSINPFRIEGQKTASFEIIEELGDAPDIHILPVGNAGNITAYWKGYCEFRDLGRATKCPRMAGFQAAGSAPVYLGHVVENPETVATAIRIGNPASWDGAKAAVKESDGCVDIVMTSRSEPSALAAEEGISSARARPRWPG